MPEIAKLCHIAQEDRHASCTHDCGLLCIKRGIVGQHDVLNQLQPLLLCELQYQKKKKSKRKEDL